MGRKRGKGRAVKSARRKFGTYYENEDLKMAPHSMVIHRGTVERDLKDLVLDVRHVMEPFTAAELQVKKKNTLKDFVAIAGPLHVTHLLMFSQTELGDYMKIVRLPRGPTIHFKLIDYSLKNDVLEVLKKKHTHHKQFLHQPLLVLNGFSGLGSSSSEEQKAAADSAESQEKKIDFHLKLLSTTLQNMFPSINVTQVHLNDLRRCVLFNYNKEDKTIDFRQYYIKLLPLGLSKPVKKLVQEKLPDLSNFQDISEFFEKGGILSESEAEIDGVDNEVDIKQDVKTKGSINLNSSKSAIRLSEIGPRMKLKLIKIQEGICDGEVLYHDLIKKTPEELKILREKLKIKKKQEKKHKNEMKKANIRKNGHKNDQEEEYEEDQNDDQNDDEDGNYDDDLKELNQKRNLKRKRREDDNEQDDDEDKDEDKSNQNKKTNISFRKNEKPMKTKFFRFSKNKSKQFKPK